MSLDDFKKQFEQMTSFQSNAYHPLVWIMGQPKFGNNVFVGAFSVINANDSEVFIDDNCDIASFVSINVSDSHKRCLGIQSEVSRKPIHLGKNVFVGSHSLIKGGAEIGHHSVVAAGTIVEGQKIPPYSLIFGNPMQVKESYYKDKVKASRSSS